VPVNGRDPAEGPLLFLPELLLEVAASLKLRAPTEAGLAELPPSELEVLYRVAAHLDRGPGRTATIGEWS